MLKDERVNHTSYLINTEIDLSELENDVTEIADLKVGSEILQVSVEVTKAGAGTIDLGISDKNDFFLNDIDLATADESYISKVITTLKDNVSLVLDTTSRDGVIKVRVLYFTESKMIK